MQWRDRIRVDPNMCHGKACIPGTRVMVSVVLDNLAARHRQESPVPAHLSLLGELGWGGGCGGPCPPGAQQETLHADAQHASPRYTPAVSCARACSATWPWEYGRPACACALPSAFAGLVTSGLLLLWTQWEDQTLQAQLEGYREYTHRVPYTLIPHVW